MGRRGVAVVVGVVAVAIAIWMWQRDDDAPSSPSVEVSAKPPPMTARPQRAGTPSVGWYEQRGAVQRRVAGVVLDRTTPVAGATVRLASRLVMAGVATELRVVTDANGHFDFGPQSALQYLVSAELPQRTMATALVDLRGAAPADDLHLVLQPCDASMSGTIRDVAGGTIAKARVTIGEGDLATTAGAVTDASGKYQLCVPAGNPLVVVSAAGYADAIDHEVVTGPLERDFVLVPQAHIAGRVVHAKDRRPIANAVVELRQGPLAYGELPIPARHAVSDDDGAFQFSGAARGRYTLLVKASGMASLHSTRVIADEAPQEIVCIVGDTATVSGKVVEEGTETPIANARLVLKPNNKDHDELLTQSANSQADGSFVIDHVLPGNYQPTFAVGWIADNTKSIVVSRDDVSGVVVELDRGGSIAGHVTSSGLPIHGVVVSARGSLTARTAETDHAGAFTIDGLYDGPHEVSAESRGARTFSSKQTITLGDDERKTGVEIALDLDASIAGVVVDQNDSPVRGAVVKFSRGTESAIATTAKDGSFKATGLLGGEYTYEVRVSERSVVGYPPTGGKRFAPIAVAGPTTQVAGIRIRVLRQSLSIKGRAIGPEGEPVPGVRIGLQPASDYGYTLRYVSSTLTDATGAYEFRDLPAGSYALHARSDDGDAHANTQLGEWAEDVVLRFERTGTLEGTLEGFTEVARVGLSGWDGVTAERSFRLKLRRGRHQVIATSKSTAASATVEIMPGKTTKVVLRGRRYGWITGTVSDAATKEPIPGVLCYCYSANDERSKPVTDSGGAFLCPQMPAGPARVNCSLSGATGTVEIIENQEARLALIAKLPPKAPPRLYAGLGLDVQERRLRVRAVVKNTPAARAGILVGDVLVGIEEWSLDGAGIEQAMTYIEVRPPGVVKLKIERGDTEIVVPMTLEPRR